MTEQELREKIVEIMFIVGVKNDKYTDGKRFICDDKMAEQIADALIAAGIGDVSELKNHRLIAEYSLIPEDGNSYVLPNTPLRITQLYSGEEVEKIVKERDEYKHRAEVAERALLIVVNEYLCEECPLKICDDSICIGVIIEKYKKQAEKELAEERKDD